MRKIFPALVLSAFVISGSAMATAHDKDSTSASKNDESTSSETVTTTRSSRSGSDMGSMPSDDQRASNDSQSSRDQNVGGIDYGSKKQQAGTVSDQGGMSTSQANEVSKGMLMSEVLGLKPQVGAVAFKDPVTRDTQARGAAGLGVEFNVTPVLLGNDKSSSTPLRHVYMGIASGAIISHLGRSGADFFGFNSGPDSGSNLVIIPANAKLGYNISDAFRVAVHGGGNVLYRSIASTLNTGGAPVGDSWNLYPNAGGDIEFGLGRNVAVSLRPDVTFTPGDEIFSGTVALSVPIG